MKNIKKTIIIGLISVASISVGYSVAKKDVTLIVRGTKQEISTFDNNVKDLLESENVKYDSNDIINVELSDKLKDEMEIELIDVTEETIITPKEIDYEIKTVNDNNLLKGETKIVEEGRLGENELIYKVTYHNGVAVEKELMEEVVALKPVDKVVSVGTKIEVKEEPKEVVKTNNTVEKVSTKSVKTASTSSSDKGTHMTVEASAYTGGGITATGTNARWGVISVDPTIIPYGTKVYIPQFDKTFIAEDCGGAIKGNKIDIYMDDSGDVYDWGRRNIDIYVLD